MTTPTIPFYPITHDDGINIVAAINDITRNLETATLIADNFSTDQIYSVGDYVVYQGNLFRFTAAHSAGAWNENHVELVTVGGELNAKQDELTFDTTPIANSNNPVTSGGVKDALSTISSIQIKNAPITSIADDNVTNWGNLGNCICYYETSGQLTNQPSRYGFLLNFARGREVSQLWFTQGDGKVYRRSGNGSGGWMPSSRWNELFQENFSLIPIESGGTNANNASTARTNLNAASRTQYPDDSGDAITRYRVFHRGATGSAYWWFPIAQLQVYNTGNNYASVIISGRIGGLVSSDMGTIRAIISNRDGASISCELIGAKNVTNASSIFNKVDLFLYRNSSNVDILYARTKGWYFFDFDIELFQCNYLYTGSYSTSTPSGTMTAQASTSNQRMELIGGKLYVNGTALT